MRTEVSLNDKFVCFISDEDTRLRAYYLWENAGKPEGLSEKFWTDALIQSTKEVIDTLEADGRIHEFGPIPNGCLNSCGCH